VTSANVRLAAAQWDKELNHALGGSQFPYAPVRHGGNVWEWTTDGYTDTADGGWVVKPTAMNRVSHSSR